MEDNDFRRRLRDMFRIIEIPGDGNCFYSSISHALPNRGDRQRVREELKQFVDGRLDEYKGFYTDIELPKLLTDFENITKPGEYCPPYAPVATAQIYQINIAVIKPQSPTLQWLVFPGGSLYPQIVYLSFHNNDHYNLLIPLDSVSCRRSFIEKLGPIYEVQPSLDHVRAEPPGNYLSGGETRIAGNKNEDHDKGPGNDPDKENVYSAREHVSCIAAVQLREEAPPPPANDDTTYAGGRGEPQKKRQKQEDYHCPKCIKTFKSEFGRDQHLLNMHGPDRPFQCDVCGAAFTKRQNLNSHKSIAHHRTTFKCTFDGCPEEYPTAGRLLHHKRKVHETNHQCPLCSEFFDTFEKLRRHREKHNVKQLKCLKCPEKSFPSATRLVEHMRRVHEATVEICEICDAILKGHQEWMAHTRNVHPAIPNQFNCRHCNKTFNAKIQLYNHVHNVHVMGEYKCPECPKMFSAAVCFRQHVNNVHANGHHPCSEQGCTGVFRSKARLYIHVISVHVERKFVCDFCLADFKTKNNLIHHIKYVHSTARKYICEITPKCMKPFKNYGALLKHQRLVHEKERKHICCICSRGFCSNGHLSRHMENIHGVNIDVEIRDHHYICKLCCPPLQLLTNASWCFHRLHHHPNDLAPNDAKEVVDIWTSRSNRIFLADKDEISYYISNSGNRCEACDVTFYNPDAQRRHLEEHHQMFSVQPRDFAELRTACRHAHSSQEKRKVHAAIYDLSLKAFQLMDKKRKGYEILIVPFDTPEDLLSYTSIPGSRFYLYSGGLSLHLGNRNLFVAAHHTTTLYAPVATNLLMRLTQSGPVRYKAFLINEKYVEDSNCCRQLVKKNEARDILTVLYYTKRFGREDIFFQKIEWGNLKQLTLQEIEAIIEEVDGCEGVLWNLSRFQISMAKELNISTEGVRYADMEFSKCSRCPMDSPVLVSRFDATRHAIESHRKRPDSLTERILAMPSSWNPREVYELIQGAVEETKYWVYFAIGTNEPITSTAQAMKMKTNGYVGQSSGSPISPYHFANRGPSSGLKNLRATFKYVYILANWKFSNAREMYRAEESLIITLKIWEELNADSQVIRLVNVHTYTYECGDLFNPVEWDQIYIHAAGGHWSDLPDLLPNFISNGEYIERMQDITARIPLVQQSNEEENDNDDA